MKINATRLITAALGAGAAFLLLDSFVLEHLFFQVKHYKVGNTSTSRQAPLRILHLTDLHMGNRIFPQHRKLIRRIHKLRPDILLISGDSIDQSGKIKTFEKLLKALPAALPKLAVPGNHEYAADASLREMKAVLNRHNGDLLVDETRQLEIRGETLAVTGFDDCIDGSPELEKSLGSATFHKHHIGLIHSPRHFPLIVNQMKQLNQSRPGDEQINISYFFAGHNHGGQVQLGHYAPMLHLRSAKYAEGWYSHEDAPCMYLSRGFGTSSLPLRFMAPAEVSLFEYSC